MWTDRFPSENTLIWKHNFELPHDKTNKKACVPSEASDHPPSLIGVFAVWRKKSWILSDPLSTQQTLFRLGGCPGWSKSSLDIYAILFVLSWVGSIASLLKVCVCVLGAGGGCGLLWKERIYSPIRPRSNVFPLRNSSVCTYIMESKSIL